MYKIISFVLVFIIIFSSSVFIFADDIYNYETLGKYVYPLQSSIKSFSIPQILIAAYYDIVLYYYPYYTWLEVQDIKNATNCIVYRSHDQRYFYLVCPDPASYNLTISSGDANPASIYLYNGISSSRTNLRYFRYDIQDNVYATGLSSTLAGNAAMYSDSAIYVSEEITLNDGSPLFVSSNPSSFPSISNLSSVSLSSPSSVTEPLGDYIRDLWTDELRSKYPSIFQNIPVHEWALFGSDEEKVKYAQILSMFMAQQALYESYQINSFSWMNNISSNLAAFANNQVKMSEYISSITPNVSNIESSLSSLDSNIQELTDGFNELYPEDARNMVTEIEDEIYDSENGGISISTMQDALSIKDTADESFDTGYSLTEGITGLFGWSSDSEGWGFWSTAVQNDLDSPVNASLMEDDIVDFINSKDGEIDRKLGILNVSD